MQDQKEPEKQYIDFNCPHCNNKLKAPKESAGTKGKCPKCGNIVEVPKE